MWCGHPHLSGKWDVKCAGKQHYRHSLIPWVWWVSRHSIRWLCASKSSVLSSGFYYLVTCSGSKVKHTQNRNVTKNGPNLQLSCTSCCDWVTTAFIQQKMQAGLSQLVSCYPGFSMAENISWALINWLCIAILVLTWVFLFVLNMWMICSMPCHCKKETWFNRISSLHLQLMQILKILSELSSSYQPRT